MYAARQRSLWTTGLAGVLLLPATAHAAPQPDTTVNDLFMYGIDADTFELLRYEMATDTFVSVGVVVDQNNYIVKDVEALAYVPAGPYKGFYGMTNYHDTKPTKMVMINALDATAWEYPDPVGFWKVTGLIAYQDPGDGEWSLIGATKNTGQADFAAKLIEVDLETGLATEIMDLGIMMMSGLAMDARGKLYGVDRGLNLAGEVPPDVSAQVSRGLIAVGRVLLDGFERDRLEVSLQCAPDQAGTVRLLLLNDSSGPRYWRVREVVWKPAAQ